MSTEKRIKAARAEWPAKFKEWANHPRFEYFTEDNDGVSVVLSEFHKNSAPYDEFNPIIGSTKKLLS